MRTDRPTFVLVLRPEPGVEPIRALRAALKVLLRRFGLRCVGVTEELDQGGEAMSKREIVKVLTNETLSPDQLDVYQMRGRGRRSEYEAEHEYNPFRAHDDQVEVSCHRDKKR